MTAVQKTTVDYLRFRCQADPGDIIEAMRPMFGELYGPALKFKPLPRGAQGFQQAGQICMANVPVARMDYGGQSQRGWVRTELTGQGCGWVADWDALGSVEALPNAEPRRLDIALTTWDGEVTHGRVVDGHSRGKFKTGGRPPDLQQITSSNDRAGRTCYVGQRKSDKFFRAYEKGFEMAGKSGLASVTHIDGHRIEDIYRCELELKAESTPIGWDVIERRDQYFAGAYPFCAEVLPGVEADILMRRPERAPQTELAAVLASCRTSYGAILRTALKAYHGDYMAVWDRIVGDTDSQALIEAGVLLVDHD